MGKIYDSLLAGTSERTGRIVVANVYGNEISRIRPRKHTSTPSAKQELIRLRMKECALFISSYRGYACSYFGNRVGLKSCYVQALTNLLENFVIDYAAASITINYARIMFSKGNLLAPVMNAISLPAANTLSVSWNDNSAGDPDRENDLVQILVAAIGSSNTLFIENAATRSEASCSITLPENMQGVILHVWLVFRSQDGETASNPLYMGSLS